MEDRLFAAINARLEKLEARVDRLAESRPPQSRVLEPSANASTESILAQMGTIASDAAKLLSDDGGSLDETDRLLLMAVTDGHGRNQVQVTTLSVVVPQEADEGIARLATAAAHPLRVRILKLLVAGEKSAREIGETVGLEGGPLYHHLRTLTAAGLVLQPERSRYRLTDSGRHHLLYLGSLHRAMRYDGRPPADPSEEVPADE